MRQPNAQRADRAVVDIGSNTVRLVVYGAPRRAPTVLLNEKVVARLGRDLEKTGAIPEEAMEIALSALRRYAILLDAFSLDSVQVVATAAVRDASNGSIFLERAAQAGLSVSVLSGADEAAASAKGVLGAFPGAAGLVSDLGGGSLELVRVEEGKCLGGQTFPLGTLRLQAMREIGEEHFFDRVKDILGSAELHSVDNEPLYMVGGTWRALATYAMRLQKYPITDPHGFVLSADEASEIARELAHKSAKGLVEVPGITPMRAASLADAAAMLTILLKEVAPPSLTFSSWGLREGILFGNLEEVAQGQDPLITAATHFSAIRGIDPALAARVAGWCTVAAGESESSEERLRLVTTMLGLAVARVEPNWRARHALDWALNKRWIGLDMSGRGQLAAALSASCGVREIPAGLDQLADEQALKRAIGWGLAIRLHRRMGAGTGLGLQMTNLTRRDDTLVLAINDGSEELLGHHAKRDLVELARWLDLKPKIESAIDVF